LAVPHCSRVVAAVEEILARVVLAVHLSVVQVEDF
jgi:hypothetical protein